MIERCDFEGRGGRNEHRLEELGGNNSNLVDGSKRRSAGWNARRPALKGPTVVDFPAELLWRQLQIRNPLRRRMADEIGALHSKPLRGPTA